MQSSKNRQTLGKLIGLQTKNCFICDPAAALIGTNNSNPLPKLKNNLFNTFCFEVQKFFAVNSCKKRELTAIEMTLKAFDVMFNISFCFVNQPSFHHTPSPFPLSTFYSDICLFKNSILNPRKHSPSKLEFSLFFYSLFLTLFFPFSTFLFPSFHFHFFFPIFQPSNFFHSGLLPSHSVLPLSHSILSHFSTHVFSNLLPKLSFSHLFYFL